MDVQAKVLALKSLTELSRTQEGSTVTVVLKTVRWVSLYIVWS